MTKQLTPAARVRRRFQQGRPVKKDVLHSPLSAINEAVKALEEVRTYIRKSEPTLPVTAVGVAMVLYKHGEQVKVRAISTQPERISALFAEATELFNHYCIGLIFLIHEIDKDGNMDAGGWMKPFVWAPEVIEVLGDALERQLQAGGLTDA